MSKETLTTHERGVLKWLLQFPEDQLNDFFRGIQGQVKAWLLDEEPAFPSPLSPKQWRHVLRIYNQYGGRAPVVPNKKIEQE